MVKKNKPYIVAMTGASGVVYGIELIKSLVELGEQVIVLVSPTAKIVIEKEMGIKLPKQETAKILEKLFSKKAIPNLKWYAHDDFAAPPSSGTFLTKGMIICPCTQKTLAGIRTASSRNLIERSADVCIKEGKNLILVPREMPLSPLHLENMECLSKIGIKILPAAPGFYHHPKTIEDLIKFVVGKILDSAGVEHETVERWGDGRSISRRK